MNNRFRNKRNGSQQGQVLVIFALALALFLWTMVLVVIDLSYEFSYVTDARATAQDAAISVANDINPNYFYGASPTTSLIMDDYESVCHDAVQKSLNLTPGQTDVTYTGTCSVSNAPTNGQPSSNSCQVTVMLDLTIQFPFSLPGYISITRATVQATEYAQPVIGTTTPDTNNPNPIAGACQNITPTSVTFNS